MFGRIFIFSAPEALTSISFIIKYMKGKSITEKIFFFWFFRFLYDQLCNLEPLNFTFVCKYAWNMKRVQLCGTWYVVHGVCVYLENKYWRSHHMNSKLIIIRGNWMRLTNFVCLKFRTFFRDFSMGKYLGTCTHLLQSK